MQHKKYKKRLEVLHNNDDAIIKVRQYINLGPGEIVLYEVLSHCLLCFRFKPGQECIWQRTDIGSESNFMKTM